LFARLGGGFGHKWIVASRTALINTAVTGKFTPSKRREELTASKTMQRSSGIVMPNDLELLSIKLDASYTHIHTARHAPSCQSGPQAWCNHEEIMEVLNLCVVQDVQACSIGVPILAEEFEKRWRKKS